MTALRPCIEARCPRLTSRTRCKEHQRSRDYTRNRPYQDPRWIRLRAEVVRKAGGRCHWCNVPGKRLLADHITPISQGGEPYDPANVVASCFSCNRRRATPMEPPC